MTLNMLKRHVNNTKYLNSKNIQEMLKETL